MAKVAVRAGRLSIRAACGVFMISETCYRYQPKLSDKNTLIADWLLGLTNRQRNWGFQLCFLYLRNVKGFKWNHKRGGERWSYFVGQVCGDVKLFYVV